MCFPGIGFSRRCASFFPPRGRKAPDRVFLRSDVENSPRPGFYNCKKKSVDKHTWMFILLVKFLSAGEHRLDNQPGNGHDYHVAWCLPASFSIQYLSIIRRLLDMMDRSKLRSKLLGGDNYILIYLRLLRSEQRSPAALSLWFANRLEIL